jgi:hypothetical protein
MQLIASPAQAISASRLVSEAWGKQRTANVVADSAAFDRAPPMHVEKSKILLLHVPCDNVTATWASGVPADAHEQHELGWPVSHQ